MNFNKVLLKVILGIFIFLSCQNPVEDIYPPDKPKWVEKSTPFAWQEKGIDAENLGFQQIKLEWHPVEVEDLSGYQLFRKGEKDTAKFRLIGKIDLFQHVGSDTFFYDENVKVGQYYHYFIQAVDNAGNISEPSDTIRYMLLHPPVTINPVNRVTGNIPIFTWQTFDTQIYWANYFSIRVEDVSNLQKITPVWTILILNRWIGQNDPINFEYIASDSSNWSSNVIQCYYLFDELPSSIYRWKIKAIFTIDDSLRDEASGESEWSYFEVE